MTASLRAWRAAALALAVVACSESHALDGDAGSPDAGATEDAWNAPDAACSGLDEALAFRDEYDRATCQRAIDCYSDATYASDSLGRFCGHRRTTPASLCAALEDGRLRFDPTAAAECRRALAEWAASDCFERFTGPVDYGWDWSEAPAICRDVLRDPVPRLPDGTPSDCTREACPYPLHCFAGATCGGTCRLAGVGERCHYLLGSCAPGLECDPSHTCRASCRWNSTCLEGAYCIGGACVGSAAPGDGEPCLPTDDGLVCAPGTFCESTTSVCRRLAPLGGACTYEHGDMGCEQGWCTGDHICAFPDPCLPNFGPPYGCPPALYCDVDGECTTETTAIACADSAHLTGHEPCPPGYWCDPQIDLFGGVCLPEVPIGAACDDGVACALGSTCAGGRCAVVVGRGEACGPGTGVTCYPRYDCHRGRCEDWTWLFGDDSPLWRELGETCTTEEHCLNGACRDGVCAWVGPSEACSPLTRECPGPCEEEICAPYVFVGDGEACDDETRLCVTPQRCLFTGELDEASEPRRVCRAPCSP